MYDASGCRSGAQKQHWRCGGNDLFPGAKHLFPGAKHLFPGAKHLFLGAKHLFFGAKDIFLGAKPRVLRAKPRVFGKTPRIHARKPFFLRKISGVQFSAARFAPTSTPAPIPLRFLWGDEEVDSMIGGLLPAVHGERVNARRKLVA